MNNNHVHLLSLAPPPLMKMKIQCYRNLKKNVFHHKKNAIPECITQT